MRRTDGGQLAKKVLDLAEQQGLLDARAIADLRRQIAESKFQVTPEVVAKVLVDHGHLTPYQARKLVDQALGPDPEPPQKPAKPGPVIPDELTFLDDDEPVATLAPIDDEEEIVELEAVEPAPRPTAPPPKPVTQSKSEAPVARSPKEAKPPKEASRPKEKEKRPESAASKAAVKPTPPPSPPLPAPPAPPPPTAPTPPAPKPPRPPPPEAEGLVPLPEIEGLEPLDVPTAPVSRSRSRGDSTGRASRGAPAAATAELQPLDDLLTADPLLGDDALAASPLHGPGAKARKGPKNIWDSPLLLIGGGILGVMLVAFGLLLYALTSGSAAEMLNQADEEYRAGSYTSAIAAYEKFLEKYPDNPEVSLARVRRGMAQLRQVADDGKNPRLALQTAQQVLPQIEPEEKFSEARIELSTILPDIADGFATQATRAEATAKKEELVALAAAAMELVNNPSYLPASLRKERTNRINGILDKLQVAERSIQQDKDLMTAVEQIAAAAERGNAAEAYAVRAELLKVYPGLETDEQLLGAILQVGEKERQLVSVADASAAGIAEDRDAHSAKVIVAFREGRAVPGGEGKAAFVLVEGAAYGLDAANGRVLWRRFVGYQATISPLAIPTDDGADALVVDARENELLRLNGATGKLVWRQPLGEASAGPVLVGERILVTLKSGRIVEIEAATGNVARAAQLPQRAKTPAFFDERRSRLLQLGEHSTLFVLQADTLACSETYYLGHRAGAIFVPPVAVLDLVLVVESPGDDYSLIRLLLPNEKTGRLAEIGRPFRLKGRIVTPLAVSGRRVAAMTDLGQIAVYEVDTSNRQQPIRVVAALEPGERTPVTPYYALAGSRLITANKRATQWEVQSSLQQLSRDWVANQDDTFVGPLHVTEGAVIHVRRRPGAAAVLVEACSAADGKPIWTTHLAAPVVSLAVSEARKAVDVLTAEGRLFSLTSDVLRAGYTDAPTFSPRGGNASILPEASLSADGNTLVWTDAASGGFAYLYDAAAGNSPISAQLPAQAAAPAQLFDDRLLAPLADGSVALLQPGASGPGVNPFLPPLKPEALPQWTRPAVLADGASFLISDGRSAVHRVAIKDQPQPHLAGAGETPTDAPVISPLVAGAELVFGIARSDTADSIVGFDPQGASAMEPIPLTGRLQSGPYAVSGLVLLAAEPDGLLCLEASGQARWRQPLDHGPLAGAPIAAPDGDLLVIHQSGVVRRVDPASGEELGQLDVQEPLGGAARVLGSNLFLGGSDGVLHRIALPQRP